MITTLLAGLVLGAKPTANPLGFLYDLPEGWSVAATQGAYQVLKCPDRQATRASTP